MLEQLTIEERLLIVSLPYRVGVLVSRSDLTGGEDAHLQELETLSNILEGFTQQVFGSELLQHVMTGTMEGRSQWSSWGAQTESVYQDCKEAIEILQRFADEKEIASYRIRLIEIGEAIAMAFRESETMNVNEKLSAYLSYLNARLKAQKLKQTYKSFNEFLNISMQEREVLQKIAKALGTYYI